jgi:flagellar protein FliO/FliZ
LGGEKLYQLYRIILAALLAGASLWGGNPHALAAQEGDSADPPESVFAAEPGPESFITFDGAEEGAEPAAPGGFSGFAMLRMILVLALSAAAIYGVVFFFRRLAKPPPAANPYLKVLARTPLGSGGAVAVVSLGTRAWLVGVGAGEGGVSLLAEIADQELVDAMLLDNSRGGGGASKLPGFSALLRRLGAGKPGDGASDGLPGAEGLRKRRERLDRL